MKAMTILLLLLMIFPLSDAALAGRNAGGRACLSWVPGNHVRFLNWNPCWVTPVYLRLEGITEVVGVEFGMNFSRDVGVPFLGCFEPLDVKAPAGTDCTFLRRGTLVFGRKDIQSNRVDAAFAGSEWVSTCTGGSVAEVWFDFSLCDIDDTGEFCLEYCKVTDHFGVIDHMLVILGLPGWSCAYIAMPTATECASWGSIKAMYR
jgi:hypothetical protein